MPKKAEGWLRRRMYADGETWLLCYYVPRPGMKPKENSKRIGLVVSLGYPEEGDPSRPKIRKPVEAILGRNRY